MDYTWDWPLLFPTRCTTLPGMLQFHQGIDLETGQEAWWWTRKWRCNLYLGSMFLDWPLYQQAIRNQRISSDFKILHGKQIKKQCLERISGYLALSKQFYDHIRRCEKSEHLHHFLWHTRGSDHSHTAHESAKPQSGSGYQSLQNRHEVSEQFRGVGGVVELKTCLLFFGFIWWLLKHPKYMKKKCTCIITCIYIYMYTLW